MELTELQAREEQAAVVLQDQRARLAQARDRLPLVARQLVEASDKERPALATEYVTLQAVLEVLPGDIGQAARAHGETELQRMAAEWGAIHAEAAPLNEALQAAQQAARDNQRAVAGVDAQYLGAEARATALAPIREQARLVAEEARPLQARLDELTLQANVIQARAGKRYSGAKLSNPRTWSEPLDRIAREAEAQARPRVSSLRAKP